MSDHARAEHVADKLVVRAVPYKECGTRTAAAIDLEEILNFVGGDFDFILQNASRPEHADDVGFFRLAEADGQIGRILSEVSRRSVHFNFLS